MYVLFKIPPFSNRKGQPYKLAMYSFSLLVNTQNMERFITHLKHIYIVFGLEYSDENVESSLKYLNDQLKGIGGQYSSMTEQVLQANEQPIDECGIQETIVDSYGNDETSVNTISKNPFLPYILKRLQDSIPSTQSESKLPKNVYFQPMLRKMLENKWLGMTPFWSEVMYGKYNMKVLCRLPFKYFLWVTRRLNEKTTYNRHTSRMFNA